MTFNSAKQSHLAHTLQIDVSLVFDLTQLTAYILKKNAEALVAATKEIGLEVNPHKTKYMIVFRDQNAGRIHSTKMDNSSIERVEEFKYL